MEIIGLLIALVVVLVVLAYAVGGLFAGLFAAGYFLSIPALSALTGLLFVLFVSWLWRIRRDDHSYRRQRRRRGVWVFTASLTVLGLAVVWVVAAFQTITVQGWWATISDWMFRN